MVHRGRGIEAQCCGINTKHHLLRIVVLAGMSPSIIYDVAPAEDKNIEQKDNPLNNSKLKL
eukprot:5849807-Amphidinium_carterae.1